MMNEASIRSANQQTIIGVPISYIPVPISYIYIHQVMMNEASIRPAKQHTIIGVPKPYLRTNPVLPLDTNALFFENVPHDDVDDMDDHLFEGHLRRCPEALPAEAYKGVWAKAYGLLVDIVTAVGWDEVYV